MENKFPKISVMIPVFNEEKLLARCLASVLDQDIDNYEVVVLDNNSTDKTKDIILSFIAKSDRVVYAFEEKRGRGSARNAGIKAVKGDIIAMTDADCVVPRDWLRRITEPIISGQAIAATGFESDAVNNYWSSLRQAEDWRFLKTKIDGDYVNHIDTKNFAILASIFERFKFDGDLPTYEDWELFVKLKLEGLKVVFKPDIVVAHYHNSSARELASTQYTRAKGISLIMKKYRNHVKFKKLFGKDESASSVQKINFLFFLPWAVWQLIRRPKLAPYLIISDFAWKVGLIAACIKYKKIDYHVD